MNVYMGGSAKLAAALAEERSLPRWLAGDAHRTVPRRPLLVIAIVGAVLLGALVAGLSSTGDLVRATSACFIAVYVLAILSATRFLAGRVRGAAVGALALTLALAVFSGRFLAVPAVAGVAAFGLHRMLARRSRVAHDDAVAVDADDRRPRDLAVRAVVNADAGEPSPTTDAQRLHLQP
jgi:amino acid efflux transporter